MIVDEAPPAIADPVFRGVVEVVVRDLAKKIAFSVNRTGLFGRAP